MNRLNESQIVDYLAREQIEMDDDKLFILHNHLKVLSQRVMDDDQIDDLDKDMMNEIEDRSFKCATNLLRELEFDVNNITLSELFLVATHIQVTINQEKEDKL